MNFGPLLEEILATPLSPSVSEGQKPPIQPLQLLKNSQREVKRVHFRYILRPPWAQSYKGGDVPTSGVGTVRRPHFSGPMGTEVGGACLQVAPPAGGLQQHQPEWDRVGY